MNTQNEKAVDSGSSTPERILLAAERLFSERGVDGVSLREITAAAGVNSAAAHYHFGSKEMVLKELFSIRAKPIADQRVRLLGQVKRNRQGRPALEDVLSAFLWPALESLSTPEGLAFTLLRARMAFEREDVRQEVLAGAFDVSSRLALQMISDAIPNLSTSELNWRFHFLLGSMVYTMASPGRIESITSGELSTSDPKTALEQLVRFAAAGFRAP